MEKTYHVGAFGITELESWSELFYSRGYTYVLEGELFNDFTVYSMAVKVSDDISLEELKMLFKKINEPKILKIRR